MTLRTATLVLIAALAVTAGADESAGPSSLQLENGLRVFAQPIPGAAFVHLQVYYTAGSDRDPAGREGLAHLVEHLLFTSSGDYPQGGLRRELALHAVTSNASTSHTYLMTECVCLPRYLPRMLAVEADRLTGLAPLPAEFAREQGVVLAELAQRGRTTPDADLREAVFEAAYTGSTFAVPIGGNPDAVGAATPADADTFRRRWLRPDNAVVVLVGAVDPAAAVDLVAGTLGRLAPGDLGCPAPGLPAPPSAMAPVTTTTLDRYDTDGYRVCLGFRLPVASAEEWPAVWFLRESLRRQGLGTSLRSLPGELFLTAEVWYGFPGDDSWVPSADAARGAAQNGLTAVWARIEQAQRELRKPQSFTAIRNSLQRAITREARDPDAVARTQGEALLAGWPPVDYAAMVSAVAGLQPWDIGARFEAALTPARATVGVLYGRDSGRHARVALPEREDDAELDDAPDPLAAVGEAEISAVLEAYAADLHQTVALRTLANGIPVAILTIPGSTRAWVRGVARMPWLGSEERGKRAGLVQIYDGIVNEGFRSPQFDSDGRPELYEPPFAACFQATPWSLTFAAEGPAAELDAIGHSLVERLDGDEFSIAHWSSARAQAPAAFANQDIWPNTVALTYRWGTHLGADHPALGLWRGDAAAAEKLRYKDLQKLHRELSRCRSTELVVVGDAEPEAVVSALAASFGRRDRHGEPTRPSLPARQPGVSGRIVPAFDQLDVTLALTFAPASADPPATGHELALVTELVQARLHGRLRSEMGHTYHVDVYTTPMSGYVMTEIGTSCLPAAAPAVLASLRTELAYLAGPGPTEAEVLRARLAVDQRFAAALTDLEVAADFLQSLALAGPLTEAPLAAVNEVTMARVRELLASHLPPADFAFTAVGPVFEEDLGRYLQP